ncbi:hypothetical protein GQ457_14G008940 [Hibiscus cannabinus]
MRQQLHHRFHTGRCFPGKRIGSITIVASINKSIVKCGHRLTRVFSKFSHLVAPSCGVKGFEVIGEKPIIASFDDVKHDPKLDYETCSFDILPRPPVLVSQRNLLPPLGSDKKGTIVLNLDETLVHTSLGPPPLRYNFIVTRVVDGVTTGQRVQVRQSLSSVRTKSCSAVASITESICKCRCFIRQLFSKLDQCFLIPNYVVQDKHLLPPLVPGKKRTVVLDMDGTLVHSTEDPPPPSYDFVITPIAANGVAKNLYVSKRPGVDEFLEAVSEKYEVVVFTAGMEAYASPLLDVLDPKGLISHRLYRDSCQKLGKNKFTKDLSELGRELDNVVIVDDIPRMYCLQPENGIPIKKFTDDFEDRELEKLLGFFQCYCDGFDDMRDAVKHYFGGAPVNRPVSSTFLLPLFFD